MEKKYVELNNYLNDKIKSLKKHVFIASTLENIVNWIQIILNLVILIIVAIAIWWAVEIKNQSGVVPFLKGEKITEEGFAFTIVVTTFMIALFFLSMFIAGYKVTMRWREYRKIYSEIQYLVVSQNTNEMSFKEIKKQVEKIEKKYLNDLKKLNFKEIFFKTLKGDRGAK